MSYKQMFTELFSYAAPYVFVGLAIPIYSYIDTNTINRAMIASGHQDISTAVLSIVTLYLPKLVMIPVACNSVWLNLDSNDYGIIYSS
ncbi:hypothetical protein ACEQPO_22400 [Bacillus sp. SL00103]